MQPTAKRPWRALIHPSLRTQIRLFMLILAVAVVLVAVHLAGDGVSPLWALAGFVPGLGLGMTAGALLGRIWATLRGIRNILAAAGIAISNGP